MAPLCLVPQDRRSAKTTYPSGSAAPAVLLLAEDTRVVIAADEYEIGFGELRSLP
jgi:hypothetical protein